MSRPAHVQPVFDFAIREINTLELRIVTAEDDADGMLWEQAGTIVAQLEAGLTQRALASQWFNARTGEAYSQMHVSYTARTYREKFTVQPRPRFREAYNEIANAAAPGAHVGQNTGNHEWYTPVDLITAARVVLGEIDLDPASSLAANAIVQARTFYTLADDGLAHRWSGRVWMNPPYEQPAIDHFTAKLADAVTGGEVSAAIVLVNNGTETAWFHRIAQIARAICFPTGRVRFWSPDRESATPLQGQAVLYLGPDRAAFREAFHTFGVVLVNAEEARDAPIA